MRIIVGAVGLTSGYKIFTSGKIVVTSGFAKSASWYMKVPVEFIEVVCGTKKFTSGSVKVIFLHKNTFKRYLKLLKWETNRLEYINVLCTFFGRTSGFTIFTSGKKVVTSGLAKSASLYAKVTLDVIKVFCGPEKYIFRNVKAIFQQYLHKNIYKRTFLQVTYLLIATY